MRTTGLLHTEDTERAVDERLNELVEEATVLGPAAPIAIRAFTGREWDPETGLYYYRARYYDSRAGRFISEDPIGFEAGPNMYSYVGGDPVYWRDPFGLKPGDRKGSPQEAAIDAYRTMLKKGTYLGVENGGLIYKKDGGYYATDRRTDNSALNVHVDCIASGTCKPSCPGLPAGATQAGEYHTHPSDTEFGLGGMTWCG